MRQRPESAQAVSAKESSLGIILRERYCQQIQKNSKPMRNALRDLATIFALAALPTPQAT